MSKAGKRADRLAAEMTTSVLFHTGVTKGQTADSVHDELRSYAELIISQADALKKRGRKIDKALRRISVLAERQQANATVLASLENAVNEAAGMVESTMVRFQPEAWRTVLQPAPAPVNGFDHVRESNGYR